jgi:chromosome segregation ATPase
MDKPKASGQTIMDIAKVGAVDQNRNKVFANEKEKLKAEILYLERCRSATHQEIEKLNRRIKDIQEEILEVRAMGWA